jgi:outer membrane protein assembly factor BamB
LRSDGEQVLVTGGSVYDAWTGHLKAVLRNDGDFTAITTVDAVDVILTGNGTQFTAYNLVTYEELWSIDVSTTDPPIGRVFAPTVRNDTFFLLGEELLAAVSVSTGEIIWHIANPKGDWRAPAVATVNDKELVFFGGMAINSTDRTIQWTRDGVGVWVPPCVDESAGVIFADYNYTILAVNAWTGELIWEAPLDHILNEPPTLGWAYDNEDNLQPAVFALTGGDDNVAGVYALQRDTGEVLWSTTIPCDAWRAIVYCGCTGPDDTRPAKLFISTNNAPYAPYYSYGDTYVFDAFTGQQIDLLATNIDQSIDNPNPIVVDVENLNGEFEPVLYALTDSPSSAITAWSASGELPPPQRFNIQLEARPDTISTSSTSQVVANVTTDAGEVVTGLEVTFSCDAARNQGYLEQTTATVDANGEAVVTFNSQSRTGTVTITARLSSGTSAQTTVTVTKGGDEPPPAATGSIGGTVYVANGKPARKVSVELHVASEFPSNPPFRTTTSNPQGSYSFGELPFGDYIVFAHDDAEDGMTDPISITEANPAATADVHMQ